METLPHEPERLNLYRSGLAGSNSTIVVLRDVDG
jgi:hypothetical protein